MGVLYTADDCSSYMDGKEPGVNRTMPLSKVWSLPPTQAALPEESLKLKEGSLDWRKASDLAKQRPGSTSQLFSSITVRELYLSLADSTWDEAFTARKVNPGQLPLFLTSCSDGGSSCRARWKRCWTWCTVKVMLWTKTIVAKTDPKRAVFFTKGKAGEEEYIQVLHTQLEFLSKFLL